jgi:hypothetical protein
VFVPALVFSVCYFLIHPRDVTNETPLITLRAYRLNENKREPLTSFSNYKVKLRASKNCSKMSARSSKQ